MLLRCKLTSLELAPGKINCKINLTSKHIQRFFSYLSLFTFMMVILVTANNYLLMFVGWEGKYLGLTNLLLILLTVIGFILNLRYDAHAEKSSIKLNKKSFKHNVINSSNSITTIYSKSTLRFKSFNNKKELCRYYSTNKLSKEYKEGCELTPEQKEILIGVILGDGFLEKLNVRSNTRLKIDNTYPDQEEFVNTLRKLFDPITNMEPKILTRTDKRSNKVSQSIYFWTLTLPCLNFYHELFYKDRIKLIPSNIGELLTEKGLAFWLMGDGFYRKDRGGVLICTDSYSLADVQLLRTVLIEKFGLVASIQKRREDVYRIYINKTSSENLIDLVKPYFIPRMFYKLGL